MQSVRSSGEYPKGGGAQGTTRFDAAVMRPVIVKDGQVAQSLTSGNLTVYTTAGARTILPSDGVVVYTLSTGGTMVYTLPLAAAVAKGHTVTVKKILGTSVVRLTAAGSDVIEAAGTTTYDMTAAGRMVTLMSNGVDTWYIVVAASGAAA